MKAIYYTYITLSGNTIEGRTSDTLAEAYRQAKEICEYQLRIFGRRCRYKIESLWSSDNDFHPEETGGIRQDGRMYNDLEAYYGDEYKYQL